MNKFSLSVLLVSEVKCGLSLTQHSVNQANLWAQGVILTIWSYMSGCAALLRIFKPGILP